MPSGVLLLPIARVVTARPCARFFATGTLFTVVVVAIFIISLLRPGLPGQLRGLFRLFVELQEYFFQRRLLSIQANDLALAEGFNHRVHTAANVKVIRTVGLCHRTDDARDTRQL